MVDVVYCILGVSVFRQGQCSQTGREAYQVIGSPFAPQPVLHVS